MWPVRALKNYNEGGKGTREMEKQKWQQVAKQQCSTSDSLLQRTAPTHPTRAQTRPPSPTSSRLLGAGTGKRGFILESIWLSVGLFFSYL